MHKFEALDYRRIRTDTEMASDSYRRNVIKNLGLYDVIVEANLDERMDHRPFDISVMPLLKDIIAWNTNGYIIKHKNDLETMRTVICWTTQSLYMIEMNYPNHDYPRCLSVTLQNRINPDRVVQERILQNHDIILMTSDIECHTKEKWTTQFALDSLFMLHTIGKYQQMAPPQIPHVHNNARQQAHYIKWTTSHKIAIQETIKFLEHHDDYADAIKKWRTHIKEFDIPSIMVGLDILVGILEPEKQSQALDLDW